MNVNTANQSTTDEQMMDILLVPQIRNYAPI